MGVGVSGVMKAFLVFGQPHLAVDLLVAKNGRAASPVKAASRRRRGPKARVDRACRLAILGHRGRRLAAARLSFSRDGGCVLTAAARGRARSEAPIRTAWRSAREMIENEGSEFRLFAGATAQTVALELDPMSIVDDAVQDRVAEGWIGDNVMPLGYGDLTGDQEGSLS